MDEGGIVVPSVAVVGTVAVTFVGSVTGAIVVSGVVVGSVDVEVVGADSK